MKRTPLNQTPVLLVQPLQVQWLDGLGAPLAVPPAADQEVRVVADLIEETHALIEVPALMGSDRSNYIKLQLSAVQADVPFRSTWESMSGPSPLPKAFELHTVGVASPTLRDALDQAMEQQRPLVGAWPLSYLMALWAQKQAATPSRGWVLLTLQVDHGLRLVLLHHKVPVFSRLVLETEPERQADEVDLTLKYLLDSRVVERRSPLPVWLLRTNTELAAALQERSILLLPPPEAPKGVLFEVLSQARPGAAGQMAGSVWRRFYLAGQARKSLRWGSAAVLAGGLYLLSGQAQAVFERTQRTAEAQAQAKQTEAQAHQIQQTIAASGVDTALMRLAIEVQRRELTPVINLPHTVWTLAQLLQRHPQTRLLKTQAQLADATPCAGASAGPTAQRPGAANAPAQSPSATPRTEWRFDLVEALPLSPRQRQEWVGTLSQDIGGWPDWTVLSDPTQGADKAALSSGQTEATVWSWCLLSQPPTTTPVNDPAANPALPTTSASTAPAKPP